MLFDLTLYVLSEQYLNAGNLPDSGSFSFTQGGVKSVFFAVKRCYPDDLNISFGYVWCIGKTPLV